MLLSCFVLISILVMDIAGLNYVELDEPREYWIQFESEGRMLNGPDGRKYTRGEKIDVPADPTHSKDYYYEYTFRGWDITGDSSPDIIPSHAYFEFLAIAVFQKKQVRPLPKTSSKPSSSEEEESSSEPDSSSMSATYIFDEVESYGA